jgi:hypothetical protein
MASTKKKPRSPLAPASRSPKAPARPAVESAARQKTRRQRRATVAIRKDTTVMQTDEGPRVAWSAAKPKFRKR